MQTHAAPQADHAKQQQSKTVQQPAQMAGKQQARFVDARPEKAQGQELRQLLADSNQLAGTRVLQAMMNNSVQAHKSRTLQAMMNNSQRVLTSQAFQLKDHSGAKRNAPKTEAQASLNPDDLERSSGGESPTGDMVVAAIRQVAQPKLLPVFADAESTQNVAQLTVLTRSMWQIINETTINSQEEYDGVGNFLKSKNYGHDVILEILKNIVEKSRSNQDIDVFNGFDGEKQDVFDDADEVGINVLDHGDLIEYDDPEAIDQYLATELGIVQMARKGNTVSGPKDYKTNNFGDFKKVAYKTDAKGSIDFASPTQQGTWSNPVYPGSLVDLSAAGKTIDKKNRPQHFALGDYLFANKLKKKASYTTNLRKGKWTWHHLPTQYKMVLVDMTVHAKHGHNGGVHLW